MLRSSAGPGADRAGLRVAGDTGVAAVGVGSRDLDDVGAGGTEIVVVGRRAG